MYRFTLACVVAAVSGLGPAATGRAQTFNSMTYSGPVVAASPAAVCPKCGRVHGSTPSSITPTGTFSPTGTSSPSSAGTVSAATVGRPVSYANVSSSPMAVTSPTVITGPTAPTGAAVSVGAMPSVRGGTANVLASLNAQRARQGLASLAPDPALQAVAQRRAALMASTGTKSHPPGSFAPGRYEGVGWSSSYSPSGVSACFTSDPNMRVAGAAMATGRDGVYFCVVYR